MLFQLRKCTRMRQFIMFHMYNKSQVKIKTIYYWTESKCTNLINPSFSIYRSMCTRQDQNEDIRLPPLMWKRKEDLGFSIFQMFRSYYLIRSTIDKDFRYVKFVEGVRQAIEVISNALATQHYDALDGIVTENAIKILKRNVEGLTQNQRDLISINANGILIIPELIKVKKTEDNNETMVEIGISGFYFKSFEVSEHYLLCFNYIFQRIYTNNEGGAWMARLVNHTTDLIQ
ncbi:uncharacterized protein LOC122719255 [Apis laboriosa]|uniref:uncharacterized protein LOC122719255 n=1 Tax=Apis laboriosa TaxID=183418 RepID=UPI001CC65916|nr:uncharacterized protein LOC122719255 [Apis laboriosa]